MKAKKTMLQWVVCIPLSTSSCNCLLLIVLWTIVSLAALYWTTQHHQPARKGIFRSGRICIVRHSVVSCRCMIYKGTNEINKKWQMSFMGWILRRIESRTIKRGSIPQRTFTTSSNVSVPPGLSWPDLAFSQLSCQQWNKYVEYW